MIDTRFRIEQTVLACCLPLAALGFVGAVLLRRPQSWLSRRVDAAVPQTGWTS